MATIATSPAAKSNSAPVRGLLGLISLAILLFLAAPWSFQHKVHAALHGLCAQRPSHTYNMGSNPLPYDARMNGIYLGAIVTMAVLITVGAHRNALPPTWSRCLVLLGFGAIMAADGFNSLLADLEMWHPYETRNWMRLVTGMAAGMTLGVALVFLMGTTLWRRRVPNRETLASWQWLVPIAAILGILAALVWSGWGWLYIPMTLALIGSTVTVLTALGLVLITILRRQDYSFESFWTIGSTATWAVVFAAVAMAALAIGRTVLERSIGGLPPV
jgi:uncharacterized membrane protein